MAAHKSSQEWLEILDAYEGWEGTQEQFCSFHRISKASFYYHRRREADKPELSKGHAHQLVELPRPSQAALETSATQCQPMDCRLEFQDSVLGCLKISCSINSVTQLIANLSSQRRHDFA